MMSVLAGPAAIAASLCARTINLFGAGPKETLIKFSIFH